MWSIERLESDLGIVSLLSGIIEMNEQAKPKNIADKFFVYKVGGGGPKQLHNTYKDACNEANRLAELCPSHEFTVLGVLYSVKKIPQYITETKEFTL
jgi:hypothetical protein